MASNPYSAAPPNRFWRHAVAGTTGPMPDIYERKWPILPTSKVATAGSCFAQHIGRHLRNSSFNVMDVEPPPRALPASEHAKFGYSMYSARYGNIYSSRQLVQLAQEALGLRPHIDHVWTKGGRYYDALRPNVEPKGLGSRDEVIAHRKFHLQRVGEMLRTMEVFIFTLGLTECWLDRETGSAFPTAPGSVAGEYDPHRFEFRNLNFPEIVEDLLTFRKVVHECQGHDNLKLLLTVSPVPLIATASNKHVMQATAYSKSTLRAVAGYLEAANDDIDYFPSFEIVLNPWRTEDFFASDRRNVTPQGVARAMHAFLSAHGAADLEPPQSGQPAQKEAGYEGPVSEEDSRFRAVCEEELIEAFAGSR